jgi:cyanophycinase
VNPTGERPLGALGLFGSGEYTERMSEIEESLIKAGVDAGKKGGYVQFATAAGKEPEDRIEYWKELGHEQAKRLGVSWKFIPVLDRDSAENNEYLDLISEASLIYFSGGNPVHLVKSLQGTEILKRLLNEFSTGSSLAGCSAGAMALSEDAGIHWRKSGERHEGFAVVPGIKVFPHYDKYFSRIPSPIRSKLANADSNLLSIGIDEMTGLIWKSGTWKVEGSGFVHLIGKNAHEIKNKYQAGEILEMINGPVVK